MAHNRASVETPRLQLLDHLQILDSPPEPAFDDLVCLAAQCYATPIATIALIDQERQWFKAALNMPMRETPRDVAFCDHTHCGPLPLIIPDTLEDMRFAHNPLVQGAPHIRFYAGVPLVLDGEMLGTLAVMDTVPREFAPAQLDALQRVARQVVELLHARRNHLELAAERAQRAHLDSETVRLRQLIARFFDLSIALLGIADMAGNFQFVNRAFERTVARSEQELLAIPFLELVHPAERTKMAAVMAAFATADSAVHFETRCLVSDGSDRVISWSVLPVPAEDALYFIGRDLTEANALRAAQRRSEERYRTLVENTRDLIWSVDAAGIITFINRAAEQIYGHQPEEMIGRHFLDFTAEGHTEAGFACIEAMLAGELDTFSYSGHIVQSQGRTVILHTNIVTERDAANKVVSLIGVSHDVTAQAEAENALRHSEERFRRLFYSAAAGIVTYEMDGRITQVNPTFAATTTNSPSGLVGSNFFQLLHPDDYAQHMTLVQQLSCGDIDSFLVEQRYVTEQGGVAWVRANASCVFGNNDLPQYIITVTDDITQQKIAEERLKEHESLLRTAGRLTHVGGWSLELVSDPAQNPVAWSDEVCRLHEVPNGFAPTTAEAINFYTPPWRTIVYDAVAACIQEGTPFDLQVEMITAQGNRRWVRTTGEADRNVHGTITRIHGAFQDITAAREAESRVREQAALLDKAQDAIMVRDLAHRITYWNHSAERLYGWRAAEVMGRAVPELLHKDQNAFAHAHEQVIATGEWMGEMTTTDRHGRELLIEARWTLVREDAGQPQAILAINTDITERKKLEAQFLRAQRMESIGTLAGGIAHDLNNVLSPIL